MMNPLVACSRYVARRKMSNLEAEKLLESARDFVRVQRAQRSNETKQGYERDGSHVTVGESKLLSPNFIASCQK
jgi:hypothetical protein